MRREILARLTARGVEIDRLAAGTVRQENLAYLLSGLQGPALCLAEWLDLGNERAKHRLWAHLMADIPFRPEFRGWGAGSITRLLDIAMDEIARSKICPNCNGAGSGINEEGEIKECTNCSGTGHKGLDNKEKAKRFGITIQAWQKTWRSRYADIYRELIILDQAVEKNIKERLTGFQRNDI